MAANHHWHCESFLVIMKMTLITKNCKQSKVRLPNCHWHGDVKYDYHDDDDDKAYEEDSC